MRSRRCRMLPFACMLWHCGVWYVLWCWFLLTWGRVSGAVDVCACWLNAFASNGFHTIQIILHRCLCAYGVCSLFLFGLPIKWYISGLLGFYHPIPLNGLVVAFECLHMPCIRLPLRGLLRCACIHRFFWRGVWDDLWFFQWCPWLSVPLNYACSIACFVPLLWAQNLHFAQSH